MKISITFEAMMGLNWALWKQIVAQVDTMGFSTIFRSDHFPLETPPVSDALELITSLTYLAEQTSKVDFGSLVAPLSVRDPVMLIRQAMALNDLSGGRMILGVGAGWAKEEHDHFGYNLGDPKTRIDRLEEGLEVITCLARRDDPVSFQGRYFQLREARLLPRPQRPTPILVGGNGPKRTLPLVARYADIWNCQEETPEGFSQLSARLDELLIAAGRSPGEVRRTVMIPVICYHTKDELHETFNQMRTLPAFATTSDEDFLGFYSSIHAVLGGPDDVINKMQAYSNVGVDELVVQWFGLSDLKGLQTIAREILPNF